MENIIRHKWVSAPRGCREICSTSRAFKLNVVRRIGKELGVDPALILQTSHGVGDVLQSPKALVQKK